MFGLIRIPELLIVSVIALVVSLMPHGGTTPPGVS
jgi:hypothetical protein